MLIGICQTDIVFNDIKYNLISAEDYVAQSKEQGVSLALFPEMSMTGYVLEPEQVYSEKKKENTLQTIREYALRYGIAIGAGYVGKDEHGYTNRYAIVGENGEILCDYAKIHPFSIAGENKQYTAGNSLEYCTMEGLTICPLICYDLRFPELFQAASKKAELIIVAANWNGLRNDHWRLLLQARALETQSYVIGVNRVGKDEQCFYAGNSMLVDPEGQIIHAADDQPGLIIVEVDKNIVEEVRESFPMKKDRREELYSAL